MYIQNANVLPTGSVVRTYVHTGTTCTCRYRPRMAGLIGDLMKVRQKRMMMQHQVQAADPHGGGGGGDP